MPALRVAGTYLPGVITAGTFYHHGNGVFWDVHNPEVPDPADTVARLHATPGKP